MDFSEVTERVFADFGMAAFEGDERARALLAKRASRAIDPRSIVCSPPT